MKSLYTRILLWAFATLFVVVIALVGITLTASSGPFGRGGPFQRLHRALLADARLEYELRGQDALRDWLERFRRTTQTEAYLTESNGRDLVSGEDRSALLQEAARSGLRWPWPPKRLVATTASEDDQWRLIVLPPAPVPLEALAPYYLVIVLMVAGMCGLLTIYLVKPLRQLSRAVDRFGRGDLAARSRLKRRDEIGDLGRVFDDMAERIGTLLTAERRLLQDIAHELRSPLARLSFAAEWLDSGEDRPGATAQIRKDVDRLAALVGSLMEMTRAEGDPSARRRELVDIGALLEAIAGECRVEAEAKGASIRVTHGEGDCTKGDPELLRRAIENVLRNGIRYTAPGTAVELESHEDRGAIEVTVRDYGPGVPEAHLDQIFAPFFRVDPSRDAATGGIGLGLSITRRAVALHHGEVVAANAHPGLRVSLRLLVGTAS